MVLFKSLRAKSFSNMTILSYNGCLMFLPNKTIQCELAKEALVWILLNTQTLTLACDLSEIIIKLWSHHYRIWLAVECWVYACDD